MWVGGRWFQGSSQSLVVSSFGRSHRSIPLKSGKIRLQPARKGSLFFQTGQYICRVKMCTTWIDITHRRVRRSTAGPVYKFRRCDLRHEQYRLARSDNVNIGGWGAGLCASVFTSSTIIVIVYRLSQCSVFRFGSDTCIVVVIIAYREFFCASYRTETLSFRYPTLEVPLAI